MSLTPESLVVLLAALTVFGGLAMTVAGALGWTTQLPGRRRSRTEQTVRAWFGKDKTSARAWWARGNSRLGSAVIVGLLVWLITSWPMGGLITAAVVAGLPWLLTPGSGAKREIARLEAVGEWVRRLSDIHTVGVSLEQSVQRSLDRAPSPIRAEVSLVVSRLAAGWQPQDAYRAFADELNDATVDEVVALLILHAEDRGAGLSRALRDLADALQHELLMRREVEADREKPRTNDRWVTIFCLGIFGITMLSGGYVEPYTTVTGQLVLVGVGIGFVVVKFWMRSMAVTEPHPRFLSPADHAGHTGQGGKR
ncbi:type II secretion system F family protein [Streptomyces xiamenensis]|uniref:type II secretion system F family protein n=1 Tax=Streptomyces xiamenensis TaxID=408015 RepID=UPI0036F087F9